MKFVSSIYYSTLVRSFRVILTVLFPGLQYAETASRYRGKLYITIRNPSSYTRKYVHLLMNFQYAHLYVKTNMVFIPNNIPYLKIIFALCELFSVERDLQVLGMRRWRELATDRKKWKDIIRQAKAHSGL